MSDGVYTIPMCTRWSCVCVCFGGERCVSPSEPQTRNSRESRQHGRLHFHQAAALSRFAVASCSVCIHYNYIHTYIHEMYGVCNRSVHNRDAGGVAA